MHRAELNIGSHGLTRSSNYLASYFHLVTQVAVLVCMELLGETPSLSPPMQNSSSPTDNEPDDIKKLLKWQDERQARRLRGEYESAVLHLSELVLGFSTFL